MPDLKGKRIAVLNAHTHFQLKLMGTDLDEIVNNLKAQGAELYGLYNMRQKGSLDQFKKDIDNNEPDTVMVIQAGGSVDPQWSEIVNRIG